MKIWVDKPLQRGLFVTDGVGWKSWVYVRYEKLPEFCYRCGYIGHSEKDCSGRDREGEVVQWPYDPLLLASPSRARRMCSGTQFPSSSDSSKSVPTGSASSSPSVARLNLQPIQLL